MWETVEKDSAVFITNGTITLISCGTPRFRKDAAKQVCKFLNGGESSLQEFSFNVHINDPRLASDDGSLIAIDVWRNPDKIWAKKQFYQLFENVPKGFVI